MHADRGSSMTSKPVALLLAELGVTKTHSRPYTSTDNPYSEAQFRTLKYRPGFPAGPAFPPGSTRSSRQGRSAASSSTGTTGSTVTQGSA